MSEKRDYYEVLGVSKTATDDELKRAFRKLAKQYHPDTNQENKTAAEAKFKEVNEAYETLSDKQKRSMYDQFGHAASDGFGGQNGYYSYGNGFNGFDGFDFDLGDIFSSFFGGSSRGRGSAQAGPRRGADLKLNLEITFEESALGVEKDISITREDTCSSCSGSGAKKGTTAETCKTCGGSGQVRQMQTTILGQIQTTKTCSTCGGVGKVIKEPCTECRGKGKVRKPFKTKLTIPAGIDDGQTLVIRGEGEAGERGGPKGDIYVVVHIKRHDIYTRKGNNILCDIPITFTQATLGADIQIPLVDGTKETHRIPEGTQTGTKFAIRGRGFKSINGYGQGDLVFTAIVQVPKKLTDEQKHLLTELAKTMNEQPPIKKKGFFG